MRNTFTVQAEPLASAVHYAAKWLATKPVIPAHGGILFEVDGDRLSVFGFNENATAKAVVEIDASDEPKGSFVVSGRLIDALVGTFSKKPVRFEQDGAAITVTTGSFRATMPAMSASDYPALPSVAALAGRVNGSALADAIRRVGAAASTDLTKRIDLCGIHVNFDEEAGAEGRMTLTLTATDTYRAATQRVEWEPEDGGAPYGEASLPPAAALVDAADAFDGSLDLVDVGWDEGVFSLSTATRSLVVRSFDVPQHPAEQLRQMFAAEHPAEVTLHVADLSLPLKRADLLRSKESDAVRLALGPDTMAVEVSGMNIGAEAIEVEYDGPDTAVMFKSPLLRAALATTPGGTAVLRFTPGKTLAAVITSPADPAWSHIIVPLREMK